MDNFNIENILIFLNPTLIFTSIIGGILWGRFYNKRLHIVPSVIYHKFLTGICFITLLLAVASLTNINGHEATLGAYIIWTIFCVSIRLGEVVL